MVGQFKDDQVQTQTGNIYITSGLASKDGVFAKSLMNEPGMSRDAIQSTSGGSLLKFETTARNGATTHGKQKGVKFIIKVL